MWLREIAVEEPDAISCSGIFIKVVAGVNAALAQSSSSVTEKLIESVYVYVTSSNFAVITI